jgi:hypothetical protein
MKQADTLASMKESIFQVYQMQLHDALEGNCPLSFHYEL